MTPVRPRRALEAGAVNQGVKAGFLLETHTCSLSFPGFWRRLCSWARALPAPLLLAHLPPDAHLSRLPLRVPVTTSHPLAWSRGISPPQNP